MLDAKKLSAQEIISLVPDVEILVAGPSGIQTISDELFAGLPDLKFISILSVGYDWVDVDSIRRVKIPVSTIKGANAESVAEHTWAMILDLGKRVTELNRDLISKGEYRFHNYMGKEVYKKTIGIIGVGEIGSRVARIARGFEMRILGVNESGKALSGIEMTDLDTLFSESDVIAVCVPLTAKTKGLIGSEQIARMKDEVILVNCSREEAVEKDAIIEAVHSGKVFGYGVETAVMKPVPQDDPYLSHPRILVTPHNAFHTFDAEMRSFETMIENIELFLAGKPRNLI